MPTLSRRHLVTTAAALPALAVPASAHATACTLPSDLIERFVMRAWFVEDHAQYQLYGNEHNKKFEAATGVTADEYFDIDYMTIRTTRSFRRFRPKSGKSSSTKAGGRTKSKKPRQAL